MTDRPFVPHQDRHPLHGITVVVDTADRVYVGRLDTADGQTVVLKDVGYHEDRAGRDEYLARTVKFGVRRRELMVAIPASAVAGIQPLTELTSDS